MDEHIEEESCDLHGETVGESLYTWKESISVEMVDDEIVLLS